MTSRTTTRCGHDRQPHCSPCRKARRPQLTRRSTTPSARLSRQHGLAAFTMPRDAALAHEAGHAIVGAHEGFAVRRVTVFSRSVSGVEAWGGFCAEAGGRGPPGRTRAQTTICAAPASSSPGSPEKPSPEPTSPARRSMNWSCRSWSASNAAVKLDDDPSRSDDEYRAYAEQLWHEQVWTRGASPSCAPTASRSCRSCNCLHEKESVQGARLRQALAQVRRITS